MSFLCCAPKRFITLLVLASALATHSAHSFRRTLGENGEPIAWPSSCFYYSVQEDGSDNISFESLQKLIRASFNTWEAPDCSYFFFEETEPAATSAAEFNLDRGNVNLLVFRETKKAWRYDSGIIALTSVNYDKKTNQIMDVDIEFNGAYNDFGSRSSYPDNTTLIDLQSTATHEIGHTVGLEHPTAHPEATMAPYGEPGEITKRSLSKDDTSGLCSIYPFEDDPGICELPYCGLDLDGSSTTCIRPTGSAKSCQVSPEPPDETPPFLAAVSRMLL